MFGKIISSGRIIGKDDVETESGAERNWFFEKDINIAITLMEMTSIVRRNETLMTRYRHTIPFLMRSLYTSHYR